MDNTKLISTYLRTQTAKQTALELGVPAWKVTARLAKLRKAGVNVPKFHGVVISPEEVSQLNSLIAQQR